MSVLTLLKETITQLFNSSRSRLVLSGEREKAKTSWTHDSRKKDFDKNESYLLNKTTTLKFSNPNLAGVLLWLTKTLSKNSQINIDQLRNYQFCN